MPTIRLENGKLVKLSLLDVLVSDRTLELEAALRRSKAAKRAAQERTVAGRGNPAQSATWENTTIEKRFAEKAHAKGETKDTRESIAAAEREAIEKAAVEKYLAQKAAEEKAAKEKEEAQRATAAAPFQKYLDEKAAAEKAEESRTAAENNPPADCRGTDDFNEWGDATSNTASTTADKGTNFKDKDILSEWDARPTTTSTTCAKDEKCWETNFLAGWNNAESDTASITTSAKDARCRETDVLNEWSDAGSSTTSTNCEGVKCKDIDTLTEWNGAGSIPAFSASAKGEKWRDTNILTEWSDTGSSAASTSAKVSAAYVWNTEQDQLLRKLKLADNTWRAISSELENRPINELKRRWAKIRNFVHSSDDEDHHKSKAVEKMKRKGKHKIDSESMSRRVDSDSSDSASDRKWLAGSATWVESRSQKRHVSFADPLVTSDRDNSTHVEEARQYFHMDDNFTLKEIILLHILADRYDKEKWLRVSSRFFEKTGRRISPDDAKLRVQKDLEDN